MLKLFVTEGRKGNVTFNYLEVRIEMRLQEMAGVTFKMIRPVS